MHLAAAPADSIAELYRGHHGWLHAWLCRKMGCAHHAADLAHDTFVRLIAKGSTPPPEQSRAYLAQIANGLVVDLYRRRRIEAAYLETIAHLPEPQAPSPETRAMVIETLVEIDALLDSLPAKARQAFLLCRLEGLSYRDIAVRLGVSASSVEKFVARALAACYQSQFAVRPRA